MQRIKSLLIFWLRESYAKYYQELDSLPNELNSTNPIQQVPLHFNVIT